MIGARWKGGSRPVGRKVSSYSGTLQLIFWLGTSFQGWIRQVFPSSSLTFQLEEDPYCCCCFTRLQIQNLRGYRHTHNTQRTYVCILARTSRFFSLSMANITTESLEFKFEMYPTAVTIQENPPRTMLEFLTDLT